MPVFSKYLYKEFFKLLLLSLFAFIAIYIMVHFFGKVDNFIEARVPRAVIIQYLLYLLPFIVVQMLPPAILIAVIIMFSLMRKNNEIMALKACGIKVFDFMSPVFVLGFLLSLTLFVFSESIVPYASARANGLWRVYVEKKSGERTYGRDHIWYKSKNAIYWIARFDPGKNAMYGPTFYFFDPAFHLLKRIDGKVAVWKGHAWEVRNGITLTGDREGGYALSRFKKIYLKIPEQPETFAQEERQPEEMGYWQLKRFAEKVQDEGYDASRYFVDLNIKLSFPFIVFIMVLLGAPIALLQNRGGTPVSIAAGVVACFCYLVVLGLSRSLGLAGILPPVLSAWLANGIFFFLGSFLILKLDQ
ncbi:MAG: LPS export ABC transporter permease LptG [Deltaproteobacteria bacterium]|nr:LPS export ABC transporter permease LptG [Deltaproteobacteria bacterium]